MEDNRLNSGERLNDSYPNVEADRTTISVEHKWMDFNSEGCYVFLFEFSRHVAFDESCLSGTTIAYQDALERWDVTFCCHFCLLWIWVKRKSEISCCDWIANNLNEWRHAERISRKWEIFKVAMVYKFEKRSILLRTWDICAAHVFYRESIEIPTELLFQAIINFTLFRTKITRFSSITNVNHASDDDLNKLPA